MQVHGLSARTHNYVVAASLLDHVGDQARRDRRTTLVLLVLAGVKEVGDHGCHAACGRGLARVNHDEQLHERRVRAEHIATLVLRQTRRVDDVHVALTHRFGNADNRLACLVLRDSGLAQVDTKSRQQQRTACTRGARAQGGSNPRTP